MKISLKFMLLVVAMLMLGFSARAGGITEEQAKAIAQSFLQSRKVKYQTTCTSSNAERTTQYPDW